MLARIRKAQEEKEGGFTLIELLVVMIIIGILAAIAIPVFLSQRAKAQDSAAKADVSTIGKEIATYYVDGTGTGVVTKATTAVAASAGVSDAVPVGNYQLVAGSYTYNLGKASDNVEIPATQGTATQIVSDSLWCISVRNPKGDKKSWAYSSAGGLQTGSCTAGVRVP